MHSRDMEYIVGLLKNGKDAEAILSAVSYTHLTLPTNSRV